MSTQSPGSGRPGLLGRLLGAFGRGPAAPQTADFGAIQALIDQGSYAKALEAIRPLAEAGVPRARLLLGRMMVAGHGLVPNPAEGARWLLRAAEQGEAEAQGDLAVIYALGREGIEAHQPFAKWYAETLERGAALPSLAIGNLFPEGLSIERDYERAAAWARKAADQGVVDAQANLGMFHLHGKGVPIDPAQARHWLTLAAEGGNIQAATWLGLIHAGDRFGAPDWDRGYHWLEVGAKAGDPLAQMAWGQLLMAGAGGRPKDLATGIAAVAMAASKGLADAQFLMGCCAESGFGVAQDLDEAESWWRRAADQNHVDAIKALARLYALGGLGQKNPVDSARLFHRAAELGDAEAQMIYGRHLLIGYGVLESMTEAERWFRRSLATEHRADAAYELGRVLTMRAPEAPASDEALSQLDAAIAGNNPDAHLLLAELIDTGRAPARPHAMAARLRSQAAELGQTQALISRAHDLIAGRQTKDPETTRAWLRAAADLGDPASQISLAGRLASGNDGLARDLSEAIQLLEQAVWTEDALSQRALGWLLVYGEGVSHDVPRGVALLYEAARKEDAGAMYAIGQVALDGLCGESDPKLAAEWFHAAATRGNPEAQLRLGRLYQIGNGVELNEAVAFSWYLQSANQGNLEAKILLDAISQKNSAPT